MTTSRISLDPAPIGTSGARPPRGEYFPALDGLRAIAFLLVFATHYLQMPWGWAGVDVFFVLSGFLITGILYDTRDDPCRTRNFYVRRTLRIFPLYYVLILATVLLYPIFRWQWSRDWLVWPAYIGNFVGLLRPASGSPLWMMGFGHLHSLAFPQVTLNFGHFWSLCIEEQFYLVWPCIVFWIRDRRKLMGICIFSILVCPLLRALAPHALPGLTADAIYRLTPVRIDSLLLGGLVALVRRAPSAQTLLSMASFARIGFIALIAAGLLWIALDPAARHARAGYLYPAWDVTWGLSLMDLYAACVIVMALEYSSVASRILSLKPLRWLGRISYGAYLFHDIPSLPIAHWAARHSAHHAQFLTAVVAFAFTLVAAWASFRWFEMPFIKMKERLTPNALPEREQARNSGLLPTRHVA